MTRRGFTGKDRSRAARRPRRVKSRLSTSRLELFPLDPGAAAALPRNRDLAAEIIGAALSDGWPQPELVNILPKQIAIGPEMAHFGIWLLIERETSTVVGDSGFHGPPSPQGILEIGYGIVPGRRRRGYATEAARALIGWARQQTGVEAVVAECEPANEASIRTLERLGFRLTARTAGELRWRI
jgi:ribosomal-protein-alanine N-acetyltransferase